MIVTLVHIWVKPEYRDEFLKFTIDNHEKSLLEIGNLRFDILEDVEDSCKFILYEAYESEQAAAQHKETNHYNEWREKVAEMMAKPRKGERHTIIKPNDKALW